MALNLEWEPRLQMRRGSRIRLSGIPVYYDFNWRAVFGHDRAAFPRGQILAKTVMKQCPAGLKPALLLTQNADGERGFVEVDDYFLFVVTIDEWLKTPDNAALSYAHSHLPVDLADLRKLAGSDIDLDTIAEWLAGDTGRRAELLNLLDSSALDAASFDDALNALASLGDLQSEQVEKLVEFVVSISDERRQADLVRGVTGREVGRRATAKVLGERAPDRMRDARAELAEYERLLINESTTETVMQNYLADHPLLFGLEYARIRPQASGPSGSMDFILEGLDGFNDIVELKGPNEKIVISTPRPAGDGYPSPHAFKFSPTVAQALAQSLAYRERITRYPDSATDLHGIANPREPRLLIVVGRRSDMEEHEFRVLQELNKSLHRATVIPYDLVGRRAKQILDNVEIYLGAPAATD